MATAFQDIRDPSPGDYVTVDWGRAVVRALRSMRLTAGPGARVSTTPSGTTISLAPARGGSGTLTGSSPLIARVSRVSASPQTSTCTTLDGRDAGKQTVAALELAGGSGSGGGPYRVVAYPVAVHVAAVEVGA